MEELNIGSSEAVALLKCLCDEGYIDRQKGKPTTLGMALLNAEDRPRISRADAEKILAGFLTAVRGTNERADTRVFIERVYVFGSYLSNRSTLGDIDVLLVMPLPDDCEQEDMDEQERVAGEVRVSPYLSFHSEFDLVAATAPKRLLYERVDMASGSKDNK